MSGGDGVQRLGGTESPRAGPYLGLDGRAVRRGQARQRGGRYLPGRPGVPGCGGRARAGRRGARVFDLSGAFRLRDPEFRQRWYPHSPSVDVPLTYGLTERYRKELSGGAAHRVRRLLSDRRRPRAAAARRRGSAWSPASSSTRSPACPAPARRRPSGRTSPSATAASRPTACSRIGMRPKSSRSWACRSRSCRTSCRSIAASSKRSTRV